MSKRRKSITAYLNITLALLLMLLLYKIGGSALVMIFLTVGIGFGAIYLSGESFTGIFRKRINVSSLEELRRLDPYQFEKVVGD